LICGDPYSFQGHERDVVFLSLVAATEGDRSHGPRRSTVVGRGGDHLLPQTVAVRVEVLAIACGPRTSSSKRHFEEMHHSATLAKSSTSSSL
jgi:hypothetical protein